MKASSFNYGWVVVGAGALMTCVGFGTMLSLAVFLHSPQTQHLIADLSHFLPPDPCRPLAEVWNVAVGIENRTGVKFPVLFEVLLSLMSDRQCNATITTTTTPTTSAQPIISIAPSGT